MKAKLRKLFNKAIIETISKEMFASNKRYNKWLECLKRETLEELLVQGKNMKSPKIFVYMNTHKKSISYVNEHFSGLRGEVGIITSEEHLRGRRDMILIVDIDILKLLFSNPVKIRNNFIYVDVR